MKIRIITASAGSGKTTRLSKVLDEAIGAGRAEPDRIVATTFTKQAAAELVERARARLLQSGRGDAAHRLLAARIGTVNSVCGALVSDFAFELGLSPSLRVLDESAAEIELNRALDSVVPTETANRLQQFTQRFDMHLNWSHEVRKIVEAARANGITGADLPACARRSRDSLDACLGPCEADGAAIEAALMTAVEAALAAIDLEHDTTKGSREYVAWLGEMRRDLRRGRLRWGDWAKLAGSKQPCSKSLEHTRAVEEAAARHLRHPGLRAEMHELIELLFGVAEAGIDAYQEHKRQRGVIDYVDQETLAWQLLQRDDIREALAGQIDLVLVDEFQDTSPLQLAIFLQLAALAKESVWVGDPKQAIYGFRGTDPKLMDAAIEALTSETNDPELVQQAVEAVRRHSRIESLSTSYRSRPPLVELTSDIFAPAFAHQGIPEERTRLQPASPTEVEGLGPIVEVWPLVPTEGKNKNTRAACVASGVQSLLEREARVRGRDQGARLAGPGDIAVLCRTNEQCQLVADHLGTLGIAAVVPRMGLFATAEGQLVHAGLRLWLDPRDSLAAAEVARLLSYADRGDEFVATALGAPGASAFLDEPAVVAVAEAREGRRDAHLLDAIEHVMTALDLRRQCAAWGNPAQRRANLDALRGHAESYVVEASANRHAPTLAGFLIYIDELLDESGWYNTRSDAQAVRGHDRAVTVSTWHRAKGLEWPITVLYGLESLREPDCYGVRVVSDRESFSVDDPLADRWIRFWPNPYTTGGQKGAVKDAYEASPAYADIVDRSRREALRVLYVGWTRARDRVVLAAQRGKMTDGLLGMLSAIDSSLIGEPDAADAGVATVGWAGRQTEVWIAPTHEAAPAELAPSPGEVIEGASRIWRDAPARVAPSSVEPVPCEIGEVVELGAPIRLLPSAVDVEHLGHAVHGFLAADRARLGIEHRLEIARRLLDGYQVDATLEPSELLEMSDRLRRWLDATYPDYRHRREMPVAAQDGSGTVTAGTADLVLLGDSDFVLVDHKSFPGREDAVAAKAASYAGQLATYARVIARASSLAMHSAWIHFPLSSRAVELRL